MSEKNVTPPATRNHAKPVTVSFYPRVRWTEASLPAEEFDATSAVPPLSMADVSLESRVWKHGSGGEGPFERVLIRVGIR